MVQSSFPSMIYIHDKGREERGGSEGRGECGTVTVLIDIIIQS